MCNNFQDVYCVANVFMKGTKLRARLNSFNCSFVTRTVNFSHTDTIRLSPYDFVLCARRPTVTKFITSTMESDNYEAKELISDYSSLFINLYPTL